MNSKVQAVVDKNLQILKQSLHENNLDLLCEILRYIVDYNYELEPNFIIDRIVEAINIQSDLCEDCDVRCAVIDLIRLLAGSTIYSDLSDDGEFTEMRLSTDVEYRETKKYIGSQLLTIEKSLITTRNLIDLSESLISKKFTNLTIEQRPILGYK